MRPHSESHMSLSVWEHDRELLYAGVQCLLDYQRPHHIVLFVLQNVTVPHIFISARSWAGRNRERYCRQVEFHDHSSYRARIHAHRLFPPQLSLARTTRRTDVAGRAIVSVLVEWLASQHLDVDQVEVNRVSVPRQVGDLPDLS